jgi:hypothetical protein
MLGQAAGAAAAQAIRRKENANQLNVQELIQTLRTAGVHLPQNETTTVMTKD